MDYKYRFLDFINESISDEVAYDRKPIKRLYIFMTDKIELNP